MTDRHDGSQPRSAAPPLPPLPGENHVCAECGLDFRRITVEDALEFISSVPAAVRDTVAPVPAALRRTRPAPGTWSLTEYACHLRDVYMTYTIRLHRTRTEDRPQLEPMLNDLRARRFRYNDRDLRAVLDDLAAGAAGFREEALSAAPGDWDRVASRLPGEYRTARWLARQAMHEGRHHLHDLRAVAASVTMAQRH